VGQKKEVAFPPDITETFQSAVSTSSNGTVTFWVKAVDPQGCAMSFSWASNLGTTGAPTTTTDFTEVEWTAPGCVPSGSVVSLTATVTNALGLSATTAFTVSGLPACATSSAQTLAAGRNHNVMMKQDGTVWAWGDNYYGQLGYSTVTHRSSPVQVPGLFNVSAIAAGNTHTVALKQDGTVWAWGDNYCGQLGDGTTTLLRTSPVQVLGLSNVSAIFAGSNHTVALKQDGTVWAWGANFGGQLGDGTTTRQRHSPVQVPGLSNVSAIAAGGNHTLALKQDGTVWAWGDNGDGQLGDGTIGTHRPSPFQVPGLSNLIAIDASGAHTLALTGDGTVWAWGYNSDGQLGDGTTATRRSPVQVVQVPGPFNARVIAAGNHHTLALKGDGTVWAWGNNGMGQLGDGTTTYRRSPVQVPGLSNGSAIAAGDHHTVLLKQDGTVWAWGHNSVGQLGDGTFTHQRVSPVQVIGLSNVSATADSNSPAGAEGGRDALRLGEEKPTRSTRSRGLEDALAP